MHLLIFHQTTQWHLDYKLNLLPNRIFFVIYRILASDSPLHAAIPPTFRPTLLLLAFLQPRTSGDGPPTLLVCTVMQLLSSFLPLACCSFYLGCDQQ
ncbi:putative LRR receptor serine/threonine-protein kinase [Trifolium repens]|nr:putative LRR receptor serine/threonine-protein kinase [Trifolium repens]